MSAQNLLFSSLPVSNLGLYDSTTQTIQTINSDSSGNINLNSNSNVNGNLTVSGNSSVSGDANIYGSSTVYNDLLVNDTVTCGTIACGTSTFGTCATGTIAVTNSISLSNLGSTPAIPPGAGQIFLDNGTLYFFNPVNTTYYTFNMTQS